jgi:hypothetical protein
VDLNPFYIQEMLNKIAGPVKNTFILRHGSLVVIITDNQSKKHFK